MNNFNKHFLTVLTGSIILVTGLAINDAVSNYFKFSDDNGGQHGRVIYALTLVLISTILSVKLSTIT